MNPETTTPDIGITQPDIFTCARVVRGLRDLDRKEIDALRFEDVSSDMRIAQEIYAYEILYCIHKDREPVCLVGATQVWPNVFQVMLLTTPGFENFGVVRTLIKLVRDGIIRALYDIGAQRAHVYVLDEYDGAKRLLTSLGAKQSAVLAQFGKNGEDFSLWEWLRD